VQELAREKATDWLPLASEYAERMLPQIFRKDDPVLEIALPPETRSEMEDLLKGLTKPVFEADDSLGWVYQFWQSDRKDEVNKSEVKIGADELPAVTQLFTEDYMVLFLLHNTLGAWWAGKVLAGNTGLAMSALDEAALRDACKVGDIVWSFLRFVRDKAEDGTEGAWRPAAGAFEGWPGAAKDLTVLDPCMGSGHFLVFALPILLAFRMAEEGMSQSAAVDAALKDNLFGLEIDPRCTQIAAFNLALAAWRKVGHRPLPQLNLACSGLAIGVTKAEWLKLAEKAVTAADPAAKRDLLGVEKNLLTVGLEERVKNGLELLYELFAKAPWLGSLIEPRRAAADIFREGFDKLTPLLTSILASDDTDDAREMAVSAKGMAMAAELLGKRFTLVATNVPYLGRKRQDDVLRDYCEEHYSASKPDLATCFVERLLTLCNESGTLAAVFLQNSLFLGAYKHFRKHLLSERAWAFCVKLGARGFQTPMYDFGVTLSVISSSRPSEKQRFSGLDVGTVLDAERKGSALVEEKIAIVNQSAQLKNPDQAIIFGEQSELKLLGDYSDSYQGASTLDIERFRLFFWEIDAPGNWVLHQSTPIAGPIFSGCEFVSINRKPGGDFWKLADRLKAENKLGGALSGKPAWGRKGIAVSWMGSLPASLYTGAVYDNSIAVILPRDVSHVMPIYCFVSSEEYRLEVRKINQKTQVANGTLVKVPFDLRRWQEVAADRYPTGLPMANSNDPSQWLFSGNPMLADSPPPVAVARLVGYHWPRQLTVAVPGCDAVPSDGLELHGDGDGIVCLTALKGEPPAEQRLNALLADAFGSNWSAAKLAGLLAEAGHAGKSLDDWLREGFFVQHCELFHNRPFIWHIWDGRRDGFQALVNYHRLAAPNGEGRRTLEKLIYSYLGDWIDRQRADQKAGVEGADARLANAEHLKDELIKILDGEPPYDIFVRWKPLREQPLGWEPDINDGVRVNIRPFVTARPLGARSASSCILRAMPKNLSWDKDRGKEPICERVDFPWFWGWDETTQDFAGAKGFDGNRWTDLHYSRAVKQAARDGHSATVGGKA
jgi:hypothetical protein